MMSTGSNWRPGSPLIVLIVAIGVFPKIIFGATTDAVVDLVSGTFATDATAALTRVLGG